MDKLTDTHKYILALISFETRGRPRQYLDDYIFTVKIDKKNSDKIDELLKVKKISDRNSLLKYINDYDINVANDNFNTYNGLLLSADENERAEFVSKLDKNSKDYIIYDISLKYGTRVPSHSIIAHDLVMLMLTCLHGYFKKIITKDEFFKLALPFARQCQECYDSWEDFVFAYTLGRILFYKIDITKNNSTRELSYSKRFFMDKDSPYRFLDWKMKLKLEY